MKKVIGLFLALGLLIGSASASFAECAPNPDAEGQWQRYLSNHPELRNNPQLLNNSSYMHNHSGISKWLNDHPCVREEARTQGTWDEHGRWHDSDWWHQNNPNYVYQNHRQWAENHPNWQGPDDGAWDEQHHWHNRAWWQQNKRAWVEKNHPNWLNH